MTYRDDITALAARKAALDAEVAQRTKERDETAQLLAEATAKLHEHERAERLERRRAMTPTSSQRAVMAATVMSMLAASAAVGHYSATVPEPPPPALTNLPLPPLDPDLPVLAMPSLPAGLPIECRAYYWEIRALAACEEIPRTAADAMQDAFDQAAKSWAQLPPESLAALADACAAGRDAVHQTSLQVCHPRPPEHDLLAR